MSALLCVSLLFGAFSSLHADTHSLYYIYTGLSKPVDLPGIYEFTAMGLLDGRQIDSYNSRERRNVPKATWIQEKMDEDYWEKGTQLRIRKEQWFNENINTVMNRTKHNVSDLHVLQWRIGCDVQRQGNEYKFSKGIYEFGYDAENFLYFDTKESQWVAAVEAAEMTKRELDNEPKLNQNTKIDLEKNCVDWLNQFREYADEELRNASSPQVHLLVQRSIKADAKLKLTCLATGFFHKDITLILRKCRTSLPEDEIKSTGVRPNHDGTFQMRKSVWIKEEENADYYCIAAHRTFKEPIIAKLDMKWSGFSISMMRVVKGAVFGGLIVAVFALAVMALMYFIFMRKSDTGRQHHGDLKMVKATECTEASSLQDMKEFDIMTKRHERLLSADSGHCSLEDIDQLSYTTD